MSGLTILCVLLLIALINIDVAFLLCIICTGVFVGITPLVFMLAGALLAKTYWR